MSTLSGSGSTFFNLVEKSNQHKLYKKLSDTFLNFKVLKLDIDNVGLRVIN